MIAKRVKNVSEKLTFFKKLGLIYEFAINGEVIKKPLRLFNEQRIALIVRYLCSHDMDHYQVGWLFL